MRREKRIRLSLRSCLVTLVLSISLGIPKPDHASGSALADLAAGMQPGTWAELSTSNIVTALGNSGGASGFIFGYTDKMVWDSVSKCGYFTGNDHNPSPNVVRFVRYCEATNAWTVLPTPPWSSGFSHGYHHNAIDPAGRAYYYVEYGSQIARKYDLNTGTWTSMPSTNAGYEPGAKGLDFFNGALYWHQVVSGSNGSLFRYNPSTNNWTTVANQTLPTGAYANIVECSPVHQVCILGGGSGDAHVHMIDKAGNISISRTTAPNSYGSGTSLTTHDPVSGDFIFLWDLTNWRTYRPINNTWGIMSGNAQIFSSPVNSPVVHGIVAMPISDYGVIMFTKCYNGGSACKAYLYKHSASSVSPPPPPSDRDSDGVADSIDQCPDTAGPTPSGCPLSTAPPPPPPSVGGTDFQTRCSTPGVIKCFAFDDSASTDPYVFPPSGQTQKLGVVVTDIKASGTGSLRFTIPANSGSDSSGAFWQNFSNDLSIQIGEGQEFYYQWRQRFSPEFLNSIYAGGGGWKQSIVGEGDRPGTTAYSCTQLEIVTQNTQQRGFAQMYHSCGGKDNQYQPLDVAVPPYDFALQNAVAGCLYSTPTVPPCVGYKANQWMTFQVHVKVGTWYKNDGVYRKDSTIQLWIAEEGQPSRLIIDRNPANGTGYDIANTNPLARYGKVWFLPYNTGKSSTQTNPTAYVWYDDLVISRNKIADPGSSGSDLQPPSPPSNLRVQ